MDMRNRMYGYDLMDQTFFTLGLLFRRLMVLLGNKVHLG